MQKSVNKAQGVFKPNGRNKSGKKTFFFLKITKKIANFSGLQRRPRDATSQDAKGE